VFLVDVDDFKRINDRDGHQQGDRVLRQLSATLGAVLRSDDRLYRVGGDEFACLVEVASLDEARDIATRMVDAARQGPATISVGIALAGVDEGADALVDRADAAMYAAKASGRDGVGVAQMAVAEQLW
jgi:diguanylate cyclase (GGDEF)-like protein